MASEVDIISLENERERTGPEEVQYPLNISAILDEEYPKLMKQTYLDHGGTTIPARSLINSVTDDLLSNIYGNPHSSNAPSRLSSARVAEVRRKTLEFFKADPEEFDLIFTANATASIKLVVECFRDLAAKSEEGGFWYGYHRDAHTSLVGVREITKTGLHRCFVDNDEVEDWLNGKNENKTNASTLGLFAYPGQSNMTGRRLPLHWPRRLRCSSHGETTYSILDAAALATSFPLDLSDEASAPDFTVLSFYKIFGLPDLGGLIVRKSSGAAILQQRRYFGGGTVDMVICRNDSWHASKDPLADPEHYDVHDALEDGTLPFHNISALGCAIDVFERMYGSMSAVSKHTAALTKQMHDHLAALKHANGTPLCRIYLEDGARPGDAETQGATIAFNVQSPEGTLLPYSEVETAADIRGIYIRSGGVCNPGGVATHMKLQAWEMRRAFALGHRCGGSSIEVVHGKGTGIVRASLGAMSCEYDIHRLIQFLQEVYVDGPKDLLKALDLQTAHSILKHNSGARVTETPIPFDAPMMAPSLSTPNAAPEISPIDHVEPVLINTVLHPLKPVANVRSTDSATACAPTVTYQELCSSDSESVVSDGRENAVSMSPCNIAGTISSSDVETVQSKQVTASIDPIPTEEVRRKSMYPVHIWRRSTGRSARSHAQPSRRWNARISSIRSIVS